MNHEDKIFNAAVTIFAHKDISIDQAMRFAERLWEKSVETTIAYEKLHMKNCPCPACCQKEMYVSEEDNDETLDCIERRYGKYSSDEDLDARIERGYLLDK